MSETEGAPAGGEGAPTEPTQPTQPTRSFSQEDVNRILAEDRRKVEAKYADYGDIKAKADKHDALEAELASEAEKQAAAAREDERAKVRGEFVPRLVEQAFRSEAKGVLEPAALDALLDDLDRGKYVTDSGDVDTDKIAKKIAALAPKKDERNGFPDLGGGQRGGTSNVKSMNQLIREQAGLSG